MGGDLESLNDAELVALTRAGNLRAFNSLARRWDSPLYRFVRRTIGNDEEARDVCQETLLKAYQNIGRLREPAKFKAWIHHIALNLCRDRFRSPRARARAEPYEESGDDAFRPEGAATWTHDGDARRAGLGRVLATALERLPVEQRTAILLKEYQGFSSEEIAEITGVPSATVRTRIFYGLKAVRKILLQWGIEGASLG